MPFNTTTETKSKKKLLVIQIVMDYGCMMSRFQIIYYQNYR